MWQNNIIYTQITILNSKTNTDPGTEWEHRHHPSRNMSGIWPVHTQEMAIYEPPPSGKKIDCRPPGGCGFFFWNSPKKTYSLSRRFSLFDRLNFDYATNSNTFYCTNDLFDPYLLIYRTTFMALRFVLIPFTLRMCTARGSSVENFQSEIFFIVFDFVQQKVGKL